MINRDTLDITEPLNRWRFWAIEDRPEVLIRTQWMGSTSLTGESEDRVVLHLHLVYADQPYKKVFGPEITVDGNSNDGVEVSTSTGSYAIRNGQMLEVECLSNLAWTLADDIDSGEVYLANGVLNGVPNNYIPIKDRQAQRIDLTDVTEDAIATWEAYVEGSTV